MIDSGDKFHVLETIELKTGRGKILARYRPGYIYTATPLNVAFLRDAADEGLVTKGAPAGSEAGVSLARVEGKITTEAKRGRK